MLVLLKVLLWVGLLSSVVADSSSVRPVGGSALLQCHVPPQTFVSMLEWLRPDLGPDGYLLFYREQREYPHYQHPRFSGRVFLHRADLKDGDLSVDLQNLTLSDSGTYSCVVRTSTRQTISSRVLLEVTTSSPQKEPLFADPPQGPGPVQVLVPETRADLHEAPEQAPGPENHRGRAAAWTVGALFTVTAAAVTAVGLKKRLKPSESDGGGAVEL